MTPDTLETLLLSHLKKNARLSIQDLVDMTRATAKEIEEILDNLEKSGAIAQYTTIINEDLLKKSPSLIRALIEVSVRPEKKTGYDAVAKRISAHPNVVSHYLLSGNYDFLVIVEGSTLQEISQFVSELASLENVRSTGTHFILKKYKESGVHFLSEESENRLAIVP